MDKLNKRHLKTFLKKYNVADIVVDRIVKGYVFVIGDSEIEVIMKEIADVEVLKIDGEQMFLAGKRGEKLSVIFIKKDDIKDFILVVETDDRISGHCEKEEGEEESCPEDIIGLTFEKNVLTDRQAISSYVYPKPERIPERKWKKLLIEAIGDMFPSADNVLKQFESRHTKETLQEAMMLGLMGAEIRKKKKIGG